MTNITTPPHNLEAEEAVLGSVLLDAEAYYQAAKQITSPADFYSVKNGWIWQAATELVAGRAPIDLLTLAARLEAQGRLDEIGGPAYLTRLVTATPTAYNAEAYAALVREAALRRRLIQAASRIAKLAYETGSDIGAVVNESANAVMDVSRQIVGGQGAEPVANVLGQLYDEAEAQMQNPRDLTGMDSGFPDYNAGSGGIHRGEMLVIAGDPGVGKSMFAAQIAYNLARAGYPGAIYSMEMKSASVVRRWVSSLSNVPTRKIRSGRMDYESDWPAFTQAVAATSPLPIYISQATHWTSTTLRADLTRLVNDYGVVWFLLDYFDLLKDRGRDELEAQKLKSIALKDICKDLSLAGVVIHTKNKAGMRATETNLGDVSGNRQILYDADVLLYFEKHQAQNGDRPNPYLRTVRFGKFREENARAYFEVVMGADVPRVGSAAMREAGEMPVPYADD